VNADHDFYGSRFPDNGGDVVTIQGIRFTTDSIWIYLAGGAVREATLFPDFIKIEGTAIERWEDLYLAHLSFIEQARAHVIVTHKRHSQDRLTRIFRATY
jgi:hypothetical protein